LELRRRLLRRLLAENPFQPATSWWRAIELEAVIRHGLPRGRGVDLGCGDGKLMRILLDAAAVAPALVGVDLDPLETRQAERAGVYERVHTVSGDRIPEADAGFDFVFSNSVLEHIPELEPVLDEVARLLRLGGIFLFTAPAAGFHDCLAGPLFGSRAAYLQRLDSRCAHVRYWDAHDWRAALQRHRMSLTHAEPYLSAREVQRWETLSRLTAGLLYTLSGRRAQPIEIQRALGLRRSGLRLPAWAAAALGWAISARAPAGDDAARFGCLLVEARRA
jgi:SAM-dependent methyltransferase